MIEDCWHKECLTCKRMKNRKLLDKPDDPVFSAFIDGWQFAMEQIAANSKQLSQHEKDLLIALDVRFKCSIDRGVSLTQLQCALNQYTEATLKFVLEGKV